MEVRLDPAETATLVLEGLDHVWTAEVLAHDARAVFVDVPAGRYRVQTQGSAQPPVAAEVRLRPRERLKLEWRAGELREVAREDGAYGFGFDEEDLRALPTAGDVWSLLETVEPLAIADRIDGGGLYAGEAARASIHGASWTQTGFRLGALDASDPLGTGAPLLHPDLRALAAVDMASAALDSGQGGAAAIISLEPRRPGAQWQGSVEARSLLGGAQAQGAAPAPIARFDSWWDAHAQAGGPLVRDRLGLLLDGVWMRATRFERAGETPLASERRQFLGHLVWTPGRGRQGRLLVLRHELDRPFAGRARLADGAGQEDARFTHLQAEWEQRSVGGRLLRLALGHQRATLATVDAAVGDGSIERLRDGPVPELPLPGSGRTQRSDLSLDWARGIGRAHRLRAGVSASWQQARPQATPGLYVTAERLADQAARIWQAEVPAGDRRWSSRLLAAHASDEWTVGRLGLGAGVRLESVRGEARGAAAAVDWLSVSPQVRARVAVDGGGRLALVAAFGRRHLRLRLAELAVGDPAAPRFDVFRWDDDGDGHYEAGERGPLVSRRGPGAPVAVLDPDLRRPHADEWLAGVEARLARGLVLRFFGIDRREHALAETVNLGVTADDYVTRFLPDAGGDVVGPGDDQLLPVFAREADSFGRDRFVLTNDDGAPARHQGVELSLEWRGGRGALLFGATAHRSEGEGSWRGFRPQENDQALAGERKDDPNADTFARGRLFSDRAYTIKISGHCRLPADVRVGAVARYQDGQPFSRLVLVPLPQGLEAVRAVAEGRHRFSYTLTVDARVEKGFSRGRWRFAILGEAFNLLQTAHETEEDIVSGTGFRTPTARQPPRALRAGVRLDF